MLCTLLVLVTASNSQTVTDEPATNNAKQQASTGNLLLQSSVTNNPLIQSSTNHNPAQHKSATEKLLPEHSVIYNPSLQYSTTDNPSMQSSYETLTTTETENTSTKYDDLQTASQWGYIMPRWGWIGRPWWPGGYGWWPGRPGWWYGTYGGWYGRPGWGYGGPRYFYWSKKDLYYPQFSKWQSSSASSSSVIQCLYMKSTNVSELSTHTIHNSHFIFILYTTYLEGTMILLQISLCMMSKIK